MAIAVLWVAFSAWLAQAWLDQLSAEIGWPGAYLAITFIAFVPGFMNAFLLSTMLFDRRPERRPPDVYPPLTVLIAAYREEAAIGDTLRSLAEQNYPGALQVLVLDDGSTDKTAAVVNALLPTLALPPRYAIRLVRFPRNRGKAAVLNDGLAMADHALVVTLDSDCLLRADAMAQLVERYLSDPPGTRAVAGAVLVRNSRQNLLTRAQEWDFFHGIAAVKRMQSMYHGTLVAQGAFSLYDRDAVRAAGGWPAVVGEDIVLSWALLRSGARIGYAEDALAFTNVPETLRQFARQRIRWSRGLIEAFKAHGGLLVKPRLTLIFIWWNLLFLPMDIVFTFVFIPGLIAAMFGIYWIAGPLTLTLLPLAALWNVVIFRVQRRMFRREGLKVRRNVTGLLFYTLIYTILLQPVCVWGYVTELLGRRKAWGTR